MDLDDKQSSDDGPVSEQESDEKPRSESKATSDREPESAEKAQSDSESAPDVEQNSDEKTGAAKREFLRREIDITACIKVPVLCKLHDVSRSGACIVVPDPDKLPDEFMLDLSADLHRWCRVVWRNADQIGVAFENVPENYAVWLPHKRA